MAAQDKVTFKQDLTEPVKIRHYEGVVFTGDDCGNLIKVALFDGGTPYSGGGTVSATAVLADGTTFPLTHGSITGNMVSVPLEAGALVVSGLMGLYVKISGGGIICTVLNAIFTVQATDTGMVPAAMVTTVNELVAAIRDAQDSIPADLTNLLAAVAPTFSTSTAYSAGAYVWQGGKLYRFTAAHPAGTWTGTDAVAVALGNDVADLKSAVAYQTDTVEITWDAASSGKYISADGTIGNSNGFHYTDLLNVFYGSGTFSWNYSGTAVAIRIHGYKSDGSWIRQLGYKTGVTGNGSVTFDIGTDIDAIRISCPDTATNLSLVNNQYLKDNISYILSDMQLLEGATDVPYVVADMPYFNGVMGSDGKWSGITGVNAGLYTTKYIAGNQVGNIVKVTAGSNDGRVGFLRSVPSGITDGTAIDYSFYKQGYESVPSGTTVAFTVPEDCTCIVFGSKYYTTNRAPSAVTVSQKPINNRFAKQSDYDYILICWGDSLTAGAGGSGTIYPTVCANALGIYKYRVEGFGGESANAIATRQGGDMLIIPPGSVNGTYANLKDSFGTNIGYRSDLNETIVINGQECNIVKSDGSLVISGYTGGTSAMPLYGRFKSGNKNGEIVVIWVGQNGAACEGLSGIDARIAVIDGMISHIGHERYVIIGQSYGTDETNTGDDNKLLAKYGAKFMPVRTLLVNYGLAINNLTATAQDTTDIAAGTVPTSLRSDDVHLNSYGYTAVGKLLADQIRGLGYWD